MAKFPLAFCLFLGVLAGPKWHELQGYTFENYVSDFGRRYEGDEFLFRKGVFEVRLTEIQAHNSDHTQTWKKGVNQFSDMTNEEWKAFNRGGIKSPNRMPPTNVLSATSDALPIEVDYRTWTSPRVLTDVKHQGSCGNCWAHSSTEEIESFYALASGLLPVLSTQQVTSCVPAAMCGAGQGAGGCDGCDAVAAYMYVNTTFHGVTEEWAYPFTDFFYTDGPTSQCVNTTQKFPNNKPYTWFAELSRAGVTGYTSITPNNASATRTGLAQNGPLSISVAAGNWQTYETGVFQNTDANGLDNEWSVDHDVQMVGYGHDGDLGLDFWIVRNSWSTLWGEAGFIRLLRPAVEQCAPPQYGQICGTSGCLNDPHFPHVVKNPGQPF